LEHLIRKPDYPTGSADKSECLLTARDTVGWLKGMLDNLPTPNPLSPPHVLGESYDYNVIRTHLNGEWGPPNFVIHRDELVLGLCLGLIWNPRAESDPCEVWIGQKEGLPKWGLKLAETTGPLPVYVRRAEGGKWFYNGIHEVTGNSTDPEEIKQRLKPPVLTAISRIVFLKRRSQV
jgi:hypothetical protein